MGEILTSVGTWITFLMGLFSDLFDAITSNPYLLYSILAGFAGTALFLVMKIIKKVRRI